MIKKDVTIEDQQGVTLLEFGNGDIGVTEVHHNDYSGVAFKNQEPCKIASIEVLPKGETITGYNTEVLMLFTDPNSIDVVIGRLVIAKELLETRINQQ